jgi:ribosomal protein S7
MIRFPNSNIKYDMLHRYDSFLSSKKYKIDRYYIYFLFFYKDYFLFKLINKLMKKGAKSAAIKVVRKSFFLLKQLLGFQPFFLFKHIAFQMRQLFKIQHTVIRSSLNIYYPLFLKPYNQISYGINHIVSGALQLKSEEKLVFPLALCIVLLNCFVYN